jgi:NAD(P)-dependent dehydrogenase (short-subunit alcohol dehydrogenase family)
MKIQDSVALVTGANRGLGLAFIQALVAGGARKIYAAARDPASVTLPGVQPIKLDVTKPEEVARGGAVARRRDAGDQQCRHIAQLRLPGR